MKRGRVIINRNICDNAPECSGIAVCQTGALFWNELNESIDYADTKCIDCGQCADVEFGGCPVGAILWGENDEDYEEKKQLVASETMTLEQLEVDRYGATPIKSIIEYERINEIIKNTKKEYILLEFFNDDSIQCLVHSIRVEDIISIFNGNATYHKICLEDLNDCSEYCKIEKFPALAIYKHGQLIGVINGYYQDTGNEFEEFEKQINEIKNK